MPRLERKYSVKGSGRENTGNGDNLDIPLTLKAPLFWRGFRIYFRDSIFTLKYG